MDKELLGIISASLFAPVTVYYVYTIIKGSTRPHPISWGVWSLIGVLGVGATLEGGAGTGAYASIAALVVTTIVFIISLNKKYGKKGGEWYDYPLGFLAIGGILAWHFGNLSGVQAVTLAVAADATVIWFTLRESWRHPETESFLAWFAGAIAFFIGTLALESYSYEAAAYPIYLFLGNSLITSALAANALGLQVGKQRSRKKRERLGF